MSKLTEKDITANLIMEHGFNKKTAKEFIEAFFDEISSALGNGFEVKLDDFGKFETNDHLERQSHNLQTGDSVTIKANIVVNFETATVLNETVNSYSYQTNSVLV